MRYPWNLDYWKSGEWQVVNERLHDMERDNVRFNPNRSNLFNSLRNIHPDSVRVVMVGQDPYPQAEYATGVAFSIRAPSQSATEPEGNPSEQARTSCSAGRFPPTLQAILKEYSEDTGFPLPLSGDLSAWGRQGVLLWNAIPSCRTGESLSHDWDEYSFLTKEIITKLSDKGGVVFAFLGTVARRYVPHVDTERNSVIVSSHPSPRGSRNSRTPFVGSRIFSSINRELVNMGQPPIDWELKDEDVSETSDQGSNLA